jgi:GNAT superfamily N-acetyltransferase
MTDLQPLAAGYALRPAKPADVPKLSAVEVAAGQLFRHVGMEDIAGDDGLSIDVLESARIAGRLWVADNGSEPVGYVLALLLDGQAHLEQLSVHPGHGRRGLGAALVEVVVGWAEGMGAPDLTLSTFRDVAWNALYYRRLGFEVVAEDALSSTLRAVRAHEAEVGLDIGARVVMRRQLQAAAQPSTERGR